MPRNRRIFAKKGRTSLAWALVASGLVRVGDAQTASLCDDFHVPAAHIGNVESCVFDGVNTTTITFNAPAILHWDRGFRVNAGQNLRFEFPGLTSGAVLNRDRSGKFSNIAGEVSSNGRVILINPNNDIVIQSTGLIDADGGFLASTLDTQDDEALLAGGGASFQGSGFGTIENRGGVIRSSGGDIVLIAGSIRNGLGGEILAPSGEVHAGAGSRMRLAPVGESRITDIEGTERHDITNDGMIQAGHVINLSSMTASQIPVGENDATINNRGTIRTELPNGRVFLTASRGMRPILNSPGATINTTLFVADGMLTNEGAIILPDDGSNPGAPTGTRQFPRLANGGLTDAATSDFRLSRLSFSHLNGLESKTAKKPRSNRNKTATLAANTTATTTRGTGEGRKKKANSATSGKKIVLRRGSFFGKATR